MLVMARNEAEILGKLEHPSTIKLLHDQEYHSKFNSKYAAYFVMQFEECQGDLWDFLVSRQLKSPKEMENFFHQVGSGLAHVHSLHIAHHDMKPENIMLGPHDDDTPASELTYKIIDFGLARQYPGHKSLGQTTDRVGAGSKPYMTMDKIMGNEYNPFLADVFAFGLTFLQCAVGVHQDNINRRLRPREQLQAYDEAELLDFLDPELRAKMGRMLDEDEDLRFFMQELLVDCATLF